MMEIINYLSNVVYVIVICLILTFIFVLIWIYKSMKIKYLIEIIIRSPEISKHVMIYKDVLDFEYKLSDFNYNVKKIDLYRFRKIGFKRRLDFLIKRCKGFYVIIFNEKNSQAIRVTSSKVSPDILKIVHDSRALSKSIRAEFGRALKGKEMFFFFVIAVVVVFVVLYITGALQMMGLRI